MKQQLVATTTLLSFDILWVTFVMRKAYKKKIYVYGIALTIEEKDLVISEAKEILDVEDVIASIILVEDLRIQRE